MRRIPKLASLAGITMLAACGSSSSNGSNGGGENFVPQASTGFAVAGQTDRAGVTFTKRGVSFVDTTGAFNLTAALEPAGDEDVTIRIDDVAAASKDVTYIFNDDETQVTIILDGETYTLDVVAPPTGSDPDFEGSSYRFADDSIVIDMNIGLISAAATGIFLQTTEADKMVVTTDIIGFDTNPDVINASTGSVEYTGFASFAGVGSSGMEEGLSADLTLTADFDDGTIGGNAVFTEDFFDDDDNEITLTENVAFETVEISGNGFSGSMTSDDAFFVEGNQLNNAIYSGNFYGAEGETVGGSISGEFSVAGEDPLLLFGAFGANATP